MRFGVFLFIFFIGLCCCVLGQDDSSGSESSNNSGASNESNGPDANDSKASGDNANNNISGNDNGNPDSNNTGNDSNSAEDNNNSDDKIYPCPDPSDINCVRAFFESSYQCLPAKFDDRQPLYRQRHIAYLPKFNTTLITEKDVITFTGSKIDTLFVNPKTSNIVMSVTFKSIKIESPIALYVINQRGAEPIISEDAVNITYVATLTAVIPLKRNYIHLRSASVSAYNYDAQPPFQLGPNLIHNSNPVVAQTISAITNNLSDVVQEIFLTEAYGFFLGYIESHVCFFGLPLSD